PASSAAAAILTILMVSPPAEKRAVFPPLLWLRTCKAGPRHTLCAGRSADDGESLRNVAPVCKSLGFRTGLMPCRSNRMAGDPAVIRHNGSACSVGFCDQHAPQAPVLEAP